MSETPRLRSAFPATPRTDLRARNTHNRPPQFSSPQPKPSPITKPVQKATAALRTGDGPLIPPDLIDAPTQRLYVAAFYAGLSAWRIYNALNVTDELDSTWLFLKWLGIDAAFFVALPAFRIPWLEWSFITTLTLWLLHAITNTFLMYKIPIPVFAWLGAMFKVAYDREMAISEHRVKPADVLNNASIILGKQIIQILPEGSAILNPEKLSFCLDSVTTSAKLPIQINQTTPISIDLIRFDLETDEQEVIVIGQKQAKKLKSEADRSHTRSDTKTPRLLHYQVSKKGLYRLSRVIDETKLEVRKRSYDVAVVACPRASVSVDAKDKCTGDLSKVSLHVAGVPPFEVKYSKKINQHQSSSITQSIQPSDEDPDIEQPSDVVLDPKRPQMAWTQSKSVSVDINESLDQEGMWSYQLIQVVDGLGNKASFATDRVKKPTGENQSAGLIVHRRPSIKLKGCDSQRPIRVAEGAVAELPLQLKDHTHIPQHDWPLTLRYLFTPETGQGTAATEEQIYDISDGNVMPRISKAGRYSLESIESQFCRGEVNEPSSCLLVNPPRPGLTMQSEIVADKCAGNPIGMIVSLDFTGTPPFTVRYTKTYRGDVALRVERFDSMRGQLYFHESQSGSYAYQIVEVEDKVYRPVSLKSQDLSLKQDIKPPAGARFDSNMKVIKACLAQPVSIPVRFLGEGPWDLDYELVYGTKRKKFSIHSDVDLFNIDLPELTEGGKYTVILTGVQDRTKCRNALTDEREIEVRVERPSVGFGDIDGRRTIEIREGKPVKLPLRLRGIAPWAVQVQNIDRQAAPQTYNLREANAIIPVQESGTYELLSVHDSCPGVVDPRANTFSISWIPRPGLQIQDATAEQAGTNTYRKAPVCQGYEDNLSLGLSGNAPYLLGYEQKSAPVKGQTGAGRKSIAVASSSVVIKLDTSRAGEYTYVFNELEDDRYSHSKQHFSSVTVRQQVYPLPTAKFANSGKTYGYCKDDPTLADGEVETIPIVLTGTPPFSLEVAVTHHGISHRPEIKRINDIPTNAYSWSVPRSSFELGTHSLQIRSVKDSRGCESAMETDASSVRIHVSSPPTIIALETTTDYCVGDHVSFSLSGQAPFDVFYTFQGHERKASINSHDFRRITSAPGDFIITGVSDSAMGGGGKCKARKNILKTIHPFPSVRISKGETKVDDIHEGGEVDIHFEFTGTPPFEFTFIRSENIPVKSKHKNKKPAVLETRHETSNEYKKVIRATEEGTYEVVAIKDRFCAYSAAGGASGNNKNGKAGAKLIKN